MDGAAERARGGRGGRPRTCLSATEGSASEAADRPFGISNGKFQISNLRYEICNLRFRAWRGRPIDRSRERVPRRSAEGCMIGRLVAEKGIREALWIKWL